MKDELVIHNKPKSNISEDIRTIRTNLMFTSADEESKVILITSSIPGEGKSFISSNLATAFAQTGESTLLIDCDLRLGRVHKIFGLSNNKGLSNLLVGQNVVDCAEYIKKTTIPNLYVIPRGTVPPNPSELLNSTNTKKIISFLRENFDRIIFDGVPINGLPDSLIMASLVDRVVLVTSVGYTKIDELNDAKKALEKIDANIAGVVVNRTTQTKRGKYSNYYE
jgi:capsular exopolysaccharide family